MQIVMTVEERMLSKINKTNYCWLWTDKPDKDGYGKLAIDGKSPRAHRLAYQLWIGPIPLDKPHVCHHCDNPPCVNPEHLYAGTAKDNAKDRATRGRHHESKKNHCPKSHEYNIANTYIYKNGKRKCRTCDRQRKKALRAQSGQ